MTTDGGRTYHGDWCQGCETKTGVLEGIELKLVDHEATWPLPEGGEVKVAACDDLSGLGFDNAPEIGLTLPGPTEDRALSPVQAQAMARALLAAVDIVDRYRTATCTSCGHQAPPHELESGLCGVCAGQAARAATKAQLRLL